MKTKLLPRYRNRASVSSACTSSQNLASRVYPDVTVTEGCSLGMLRQTWNLTFHFSHLFVASSVFIKEYLQKAKMYQAISGLLPMLDRMVNIFGRDVNRNTSGKKPSGTRWQKGGNSPYGQVFHSVFIIIWYLPLAETIQGPVLWSSLPASLFLLLDDFLPI